LKTVGDFSHQKIKIVIRIAAGKTGIQMYKKRSPPTKKLKARAILKKMDFPFLNLKK
jgi:hypothetical protein